jgi:hypothetical protein
MLDIDDESLRELQRFPPLTKSLDEIDVSAEGIYIRRETRGLERLPQFCGLRTV